MKFIELHYEDGKLLFGNIDLLQCIFVTKEGGCAVVGWNNNGFIRVRESYETVKKMIEEADEIERMV